MGTAHERAQQRQCQCIVSRPSFQDGRQRPPFCRPSRFQNGGVPSTTAQLASHQPTRSGLLLHCRQCLHHFHNQSMHNAPLRHFNLIKKWYCSAQFTKNAWSKQAKRSLPIVIQITVRSTKFTFKKMKSKIETSYESMKSTLQRCRYQSSDKNESEMFQHATLSTARHSRTVSCSQKIWETRENRS